MGRLHEQQKLTYSQIEQKAEEFLQKYAAVKKKPLRPPIDVWQMLESLDDFYVEIDDLQSQYGPDTLGAIFLDNGERLIKIDQSLDPETHPEKQGRFNFTLAHECGHWILHAPALLASQALPDLFTENKKPLILCRTHKASSKPQQEKEADRFAGYLLLPKDLVIKEWQRQHPGLTRPLDVHEQLVELRKRYNLTEDDEVICNETRAMAPVFQVSLQAMQICLRDLGLIALEPDNQMYFDF